MYACHKPKKNHTNCFHVPTSNKTRINSSKAWTDMVISTVSLCLLYNILQQHTSAFSNTHAHTLDYGLYQKSNLLHSKPVPSCTSLSPASLCEHTVDSGLPRWWSRTQSPHTHLFSNRHIHTRTSRGRQGVKRKQMWDECPSLKQKVPPILLSLSPSLNRWANW